MHFFDPAVFLKEQNKSIISIYKLIEIIHFYEQIFPTSSLGTKKDTTILLTFSQSWNRRPAEVVLTPHRFHTHTHIYKGSMCPTLRAFTFSPLDFLAFQIINIEIIKLAYTERGANYIYINVVICEFGRTEHGEEKTSIINVCIFMKD